MLLSGGIFQESYGEAIATLSHLTFWLKTRKFLEKIGIIGNSIRLPCAYAPYAKKTYF
jgi:hypothetical protein